MKMVVYCKRSREKNVLANVLQLLTVFTFWGFIVSMCSTQCIHFLVGSFFDRDGENIHVCKCGCVYGLISIYLLLLFYISIRCIWNCVRLRFGAGFHSQNSFVIVSFSLRSKFEYIGAISIVDGADGVPGPDLSTRRCVRSDRMSLYDVMLMFWPSRWSSRKSPT